MGPLEDIQRTIQGWIEKYPDHPCVASAFWVLARFHDKSLRAFFRSWMERYVGKITPHLPPLGQILVALDTIGEKALSGNSFGAMESGKNLDDAIRYLRAIKPRP